MTDFSRMSTEELERLSSQFKQDEFEIMKELVRRNEQVALSDADEVVPSDMVPTEEDF